MTMPAITAAVLISHKQKEARDAEKLVSELPLLDFGDLPQVLRWVARVAAFRFIDTVLAFPWETAVEAFEAQGYQPCADIDPDIQATGRDESARAIIAVALNGMMGNGFRYRHVPSYLIRFVQQWLALYASS